MTRKIYVNQTEILDIPDWWKDAFDAYVATDFDQEIIDRLIWIISHKIEVNVSKLRNEWIPKLGALGIQSIPTDDGEFVALVIAQESYKTAAERLPE